MDLHPLGKSTWVDNLTKPISLALTLRPELPCRFQPDVATLLRTGGRCIQDEFR